MIPLERSRPPARDAEGWTAVERRAMRLAEQYIDARGGKVWGSGVNRAIRNKCHLGKSQMSALLNHILTERGYYDAVSEKVKREGAA